MAATLLALWAIAFAAVGPPGSRQIRPSVPAVAQPPVAPLALVGGTQLGRPGKRAPTARLCATEHILVEKEEAPPTAAAVPLVARVQRERMPNADFAVVRSMEVPHNMTAGTRLPVALTLLAPDQFGSLSRARKTVRRSGVLVNGVISDCAVAVSPGDAVELRMRVNSGYAPRGVPPFPVEVVYEDDHLAVVLKPAGVVTHPPPGGAPGSRSMRTAITYALAAPPPGTLEALYRPHLVHRLDRPTSGLMLAAKTKPAQVGLQRLFASRAIGKRYTAVVAGRVPHERGLIDSPVGGKDAQTRYEVTGRHRSLRIGGGHLTTLRLYPQTGRTHQLRIHCAHVLGCPIVGDTAYGYGRGKPQLPPPPPPVTADSLQPAPPLPLPSSQPPPSQPPPQPLDCGDSQASQQDGGSPCVARATGGLAGAGAGVAGTEAGAGGRIDAEYGVHGLYLAAVALDFAHPCCADETDAVHLPGGGVSAGPTKICEGEAAAGKRMLFEVEEPDKFRTLRQREQRWWDKFYGGGSGDDAGDDDEAGEGRS